jgi:Bacterial regulatory proteins, gntR family
MTTPLGRWDGSLQRIRSKPSALSSLRGHPRPPRRSLASGRRGHHQRARCVPDSHTDWPLVSSALKASTYSLRTRPVAIVCRMADAMTIDPDGEVAPYLQLAGILRAQIESGELAPSARLPSIIGLSEHYGVARVTAHKALRVLVESRLAVVSPGRGTYVRKNQE